MASIFIMIFILFIGLYIFAICPEMSRKQQLAAYRGTMFAHRGYHLTEKRIPENSMPAFRAAIQKNYGIELDIHVTKDNHVIVFHDDSLKRMCKVNGSPEELTLAELRKCSLAGTKERIPTLTEVLNLVNGQVPLLIELKLPTLSTKLCECAYPILQKYHGPYMVQSFNTQGLHWFRKNAPHILRGQLASNHTKYDYSPHWAVRFMAKHLMLNFWGKPDFISYKLTDLPTFTTTLLRTFWGTPFAVWTLRDRASLLEGRRNFDMQIFEKPQ